ncbi:MAG TPA: sugar phosphate isomerase/epimerase family protein [Anaerolineae bacterium]
MRYGAHSYIFVENWSDGHLNTLDTVREFGLDCFEIGIGDDVSFTPALTRTRAQSLGLELTISPGGLWPRQYDLSGADAAQRALALTWHQRQIDLGAELGATAYTGALYGHPGVLSYRPPSIDEQRYSADGLHKLAEYGQPRGVKVVIEPMSHFRTHMVNNAEQANQLLDLANHPNLQVLLDTYHLVTETRDFATQVRQTKGRLWGLHACESDRGVPGGGIVPWTQVFGALRAIDFDGYMTFESYNSSIGNPPGSFAYRRGMLHDVCPDAASFIRAGLAFIKSSLAQAGYPQPTLQH